MAVTPLFITRVCLAVIGAALGALVITHTRYGAHMPGTSARIGSYLFYAFAALLCALLVVTL